MGLQGCQKKDWGLSDLFILRDLHKLILHDFTGCAYTLTTLISNWNKFAQLLERLRLELANGLTYFFVTHTIT
jgi:hypothetical protein